MRGPEKQICMKRKSIFYIKPILIRFNSIGFEFQQK